MSDKSAEKVLAELEKKFAKKFKVLKGDKATNFYNDYQPDLELRNKKDEQELAGFIDVVNQNDLKNGRYMLLPNEWRVYGKALADKDLYVYVPDRWGERGKTIKGKEFLQRHLSDAQNLLMSDVGQIKAFTYDKTGAVKKINLG